MKWRFVSPQKRLIQHPISNAFKCTRNLQFNFGACMFLGGKQLPILTFIGILIARNLAILTIDMLQMKSTSCNRVENLKV